MMNPLQYFWMFIRGISHGFDETHDELVMVRNFKDIFIFFKFTNNVVEIVHTISTLHIHIRDTDCLQ